MRRFAPAFFATALGITLIAPLAAHAAGIPYFGPIIPNLTCANGVSYQLSALGWGALVIVVNNTIAVVLTIAILFVTPLLIAYAGFLYVTSGASPGNRSKANSVLTNTIIGIVVALAAWIIVDAVMAALYNANAPVGSSTLGSWYSIINSGTGDPCLSLAGQLSQATLPNGQQVTVLGTGANGTLYTTGTGACSASTVQQGAAAGGYSLSSSQASVLACLAQYESSCGANNQNYNWGATSNASTAYGPLQVTLKGNSSCYNNNACDAAAGLSNGTALNCQNAFDSNGDPISGTLLNECTTAASNVSCSASAAACVVTGPQGFGAYGADTHLSQCTAQLPVNQ